MKIVELPVVENFNGPEVLCQLIGGAPESGYTITDVRMCLRIIDKAQAGPRLELEDAEYSFLKDRIEKVKWSVATAEVIAFVDAVNSPS